MSKVKRAYKVVVKVGKTSDIRLRGVKALRAITFNDVERLVNRFDETKAIIIERIMPYEKDSALSLIGQMIDNGLFVCIYSIDGLNIQEREIIEKTGVGVANSLDELQVLIANNIAVKVHTAWCREIQVEMENIDEEDGVGDTGNNLKEALYSFNNQDKEVDNEYTWVLSKSDIKIDNKDKEDKVKGKEDVSSLIALLDAVTKEKQSLIDSVEAAQNKISRLLEVKDTLEKERKEYLVKIQELEEKEGSSLKDNIKEDLEVANTEIHSLQSTNIELSSKIIAFESDNRVLQEKLNSMTIEVNELKGNINDLSDEISSKNKQIEELKISSAGNDSMRLEISSLKSDKQILERTISSLNEKISSLTVELDNKVDIKSIEKIGELRKEIEVLNSNIIEVKKSNNIEINGRLILNMMLAEVMKRGEEIERKIVEKNNEVLELSTVSKKLRASLSSIEAELQLKARKYDEVVKDMALMRDKFNTEINDITQRNEEDKSRLSIEIESRQSEVRRVRERVNTLESELRDKEREIKDIEDSYSNDRNEYNILSSKNEELSKINDVLSEKNDTLNSKVKSLSKELSMVEAKLSLTEESNNKLESKNKKLRLEIERLEGTTDTKVIDVREVESKGIFRISLGCEYTGKAKIIPIFGTGSIGITTIAMSLAKKLNKAKILYMDLDLMSPKADAWFKRLPFVNVNGVEKVKSSSFGLLVEKGSGYMKSHKEFIQSIESNKLGYRLDYFSGLYTRIDPRKLAMIDFSDYLTYLGNSYDYIIADIGKLGASEVGDELIKMFVDISDKAIILSLNKIEDVRLAQMHLNSGGIDISKLIWVLNLVTSSSVAEGIQRVIKDCKCTMIEKDMSIHGEMSLLGSTDRLKGMFNRLVNLVINNDEANVER